MKRKLMVLLVAILACVALIMGVAACGEDEKVPETNGTEQGGGSEGGQGGGKVEETVYKFSALDLIVVLETYTGPVRSYGVGDTLGTNVLTEDFFILKMRTDGTATIINALGDMSYPDETTYTVDPEDPQTFYMTYNYTSDVEDATESSLDFTCKLDGSTMTMTCTMTETGVTTRYIYTLHAVSE